MAIRKTCFPEEGVSALLVLLKPYIPTQNNKPKTNAPHIKNLIFTITPFSPEKDICHSLESLTKNQGIILIFLKELNP
jgi:hypothetical protein